MFLIRDDPRDSRESSAATAPLRHALARRSGPADGDGMSNPTGPRVVIVREVPIELSQLMKFAGMTESGGDAKRAVGEGLVQVNGIVEMQRGKKLMPGDRVTFRGETVLIEVASG